MTHSRYLLCGLVAVAGLFLAGCNAKITDPEPPAVRRAADLPSNAAFENQAHNAVLSSMAVTDIHFFPDRAELNSLGRGRLLAIAEHLERRGGEVVIDSRAVDPFIREQRFGIVRKYLLSLGLDPERMEIRAGLPGGRGQDATEAKLFYDKNLNPGSASTGGLAASVAGTP